MITHPRRTRRRALATAATACVATLACAQSATALDTTIRIEGSSGTLVPESAIAIEADGTQATLFDVDSNAFQVDRGSAFWQVFRAASGAGVPFQFRGFSFGLQVTAIGPDVSAGSVGWQYKVDHASPAVGADALQLAQGDEVLWFHTGFAGARDLDAAVSSDRVRTGTSFTVDVVSYDEDGVPSPAAGAEVSYGSARATTDAAGRVSFIAQAPGNRGVRATRAGDVRSATRSVCSFDADPTVCNLPPAPEAPAEDPGPAPAPPVLTTLPPDTTAPGSVLTSPAPRSRRGAVRSIRGTAGPDRTDIAGVEVSLGLRVGTLCRFRLARGRLTAPRDCARPEWVPARVAGGRWVLPLGRGLAPGVWRVETRATDGAGNTQTVRVPGANIAAFRVRGRVDVPRTAIRSPRPGARPATLDRIAGIAGPPRADVGLVEVAVSRRAGRLCRFVTSAGTLAGARPCGRPVWIAARSNGRAWVHDLDPALGRGGWVIRSRATSAEDVRGPVAIRVARVTGAAR